MMLLDRRSEQLSDSPLQKLPLCSRRAASRRLCSNYKAHMAQLEKAGMLAWKARVETKALLTHAISGLYSAGEAADL